MKVKNKSEFWDDIYKKKAHWEGLISEDIKGLPRSLKKGGKFLDIGCGSGDDSIFLAKRGFHVWGIDISKLAIKKPRNQPVS